MHESVKVEACMLAQDYGWWPMAMAHSYGLWPIAMSHGYGLWLMAETCWPVTVFHALSMCWFQGSFIAESLSIPTTIEACVFGAWINKHQGKCLLMFTNLLPRSCVIKYSCVFWIDVNFNTSVDENTIFLFNMRYRACIYFNGVFYGVPKINLYWSFAV